MLGRLQALGAQSSSRTLRVEVFWVATYLYVEQLLECRWDSEGGARAGIRELSDNVLARQLQPELQFCEIPVGLHRGWWVYRGCWWSIRPGCSPPPTQPCKAHTNYAQLTCLQEYLGVASGSNY